MPVDGTSSRPLPKFGASNSKYFADIYGGYGFAARLFEPRRGYAGNVIDARIRHRLLTDARSRGVHGGLLSLPSKTWTSATARSGATRPRDLLWGTKKESSKEISDVNDAMMSALITIKTLHRCGIPWIVKHPSIVFSCQNLCSFSKRSHHIMGQIPVSRHHLPPDHVDAGHLSSLRRHCDHASLCRFSRRKHSRAGEQPSQAYRQR